MLLRREIRPGDVVLDIGANIGYYTIQFADLVGPTGKVIAFEPDPINFGLLKRSVEANGFTNVELVNAAVSDRSGSCSLHLSPRNPGDHRIGFTGARKSVEVTVTSLDEFFKGRNPRVDLIKMDIQGSELHAVRGARGVIAANDFVKLTCEFWPGGLRQSGSSPRDFLLELRDMGFCQLLIDEANGQLLSFRPGKLIEQLTETKPQFANLFCMKTSAKGVSALPAPEPLFDN